MTMESAFHVITNNTILPERPSPDLLRSTSASELDPAVPVSNIVKRRYDEDLHNTNRDDTLPVVLLRV